ncbi:MAG: hypothetical protein HKN58_00925 [Xanthomonadales bacterium]|nr:hypothetical protein [Xanthomonadales bacterium]
MRKEGEAKVVEQGKKPYSAPRILERERLESVAAVCSGPNAKAEGGISQSGFPCGTNGGQIRS